MWLHDGVRLSPRSTPWPSPWAPQAIRPAHTMMALPPAPCCLLLCGAAPMQVYHGDLYSSQEGLLGDGMHIIMPLPLPLPLPMPAARPLHAQCLAARPGGAAASHCSNA